MDNESYGNEQQQNQHKSKVVLICGFDLSQLSINARFFVAVLGIFASYLCYGALQEAIFSSNNMRSHSQLLTLYQFGVYSLLAYCELRCQAIPLRFVNLRFYMLLALLTLGTIGFSNASVGFLNYPTQVLFKCCKMIPVMIGGALVQGKRYNLQEVLAVLLMTAGLIGFTLVDVAVQPAFSVLGVVLISCALCCDGALGNFQELLMRRMKCTNTELLFYSYVLGFLFLLCGVTLNGALLPSVHYFLEHPRTTLGYGTLFSVSGYFGMHFVLCLIHSHGALTTVTVTTLRKALSIVISFVLFSKPFSIGYVFTGLLVVAGIYLGLFNKYRDAWKPTIDDFLHKFRFIRRSNRVPILPL